MKQITFRPRKPNRSQDLVRAVFGKRHGLKAGRRKALTTNWVPMRGTNRSEE